MSDSKVKRRKEHPCTAEQSVLRIQDLIQYLSRLANLNSNDKTGNQELSNGLRQLVRVLRPHADRTTLELGEVLGREKFPTVRESYWEQTRRLLPSDLHTTSHEDIEKILDDSTYSKSQLIHLASSRFGIPRSKLIKLKRDAAIESIRSALDHEKSLEKISQEARRAVSGTQSLPQV